MNIRLWSRYSLGSLVAIFFLLLALPALSATPPKSVSIKQVKKGVALSGNYEIQGNRMTFSLKVRGPQSPLIKSVSLKGPKRAAYEIAITRHLNEGASIARASFLLPQQIPSFKGGQLIIKAENLAKKEVIFQVKLVTR